MVRVRPLSKAEEQQLYRLLDHPDPQIPKRAKAVLLSAQGYSANEMVPVVNLTAKSIRKWLRRFNEEGVEGLIRERTSPGRPRTFSPEQRERMVELALTPPQALGKPFTTWSLAKLREHLAEEEGIRISLGGLWKILKEGGLSLQKAQRWIQSPDPEYALKKSGSRS